MVVDTAIESPTQDSSSSAAWDLAPVALSLIASAVVIIRSATSVAGHRAYVLFDDAAISMVYARNLSAGHGLVWTMGHPVEGYSNFLWTLWMAAIEAAHPSVYLAGLWVMLSGAVLLAANTYVVVRITRRLAPGIAPLLAGTATALYFGLNMWTLVGMETGLVALLTAGAVLCTLRARDTPTTALLVGAGVLLALDVLTRDDSLVLAVILVGFVFLKVSARSAALVAGPVLAAVVGHELFRLAYYGRLVPNTYNLKLGGIPLTTRAYRGVLVLAQTTTMQFAIPLVLAGCCFLLVKRRPGATLLAVILGAQALYVVYIGGDSYEVFYSDRYLAPMAPFLFVLAALGAVALAGRPLVIAGGVIVLAGIFESSATIPILRLQQTGSAAHQISNWGHLTIAAGVVVMVLGLIGSKPFVAVALILIAIIGVNAIPVAIWNQQGAYFSFADETTARLGYALGQSMPPSGTVAISGVGNMTFFDGLKTIDLLGYSDRVVASSKPHTTEPFQPGHDKWDYAYSIGQLRPDVVIGLFHPTSLDIAHVQGWGYRTFVSPYVGPMYYLPGQFSPELFDAAFETAATGVRLRTR